MRYDDLRRATFTPALDTKIITARVAQITTTMMTTTTTMAVDISGSDDHTDA